MDLGQKLVRYRNEHDEILRFLREWEAALRRAASDNATERHRGLAELAQMDPAMTAIHTHCRDEEKNIDARYQAYLDERAFEHLRHEHEEIEQLADGFRTELKWLTTPPTTTDLVHRGIALLQRLRRHIAFEEGLLKQIEDGSSAETLAAPGALPFTPTPKR